MSVFEHVVVVGAGIGGVAAAGALAGVASRVTVVDSDALPEVPTTRLGVPQGHHLHNLLGRGQQELERAVPGVLHALRAADCADASVADETQVFELGRRMPKRSLGLRLVSGWRPVIEAVSRSVLLRRSNVEVVGAATAEGLVLKQSGDVCGLKVTLKGRPSIWPCDVVVDARGATSSSTGWIGELGRATPCVLTQRSGRWYASSLVTRSSWQIGDPTFRLTFATPPSTRGALMSPAGQTHWWVSVSGGPADPIPRTYKAVLKHARELDDSGIYDELAGAQGGSRPRFFRRAEARWLRFDEVAEPVGGYLPLGDSVATLDPLYGQGMSVAAWQATLLGDIVRAWDGYDVGALTRSYLSSAALAAGAAWDVGALVDAVDGPASHGHSLVADLIESDPSLHRLYVRAWHLLEPAHAFERAIDAALHHVQPMGRA